MKNFAHEIVGRLLQLQSLEERLEVFKRNHERSTDTQALIESLRANLALSMLIEHDRMRSRGKKSIAEVRRGVCSGCHLQLGIGNVAALRRGELRRCGNCGRFLYLIEEAPAEDGESAFDLGPGRKNVKPMPRDCEPAYAHA